MRYYIKHNLRAFIISYLIIINLSPTSAISKLENEESPQIVNELDINIGNKITFLGYNNITTKWGEQKLELFFR